MNNWRSYAYFAAWSLLLLLLLPALWYSLRTPFGLIDDYSLWPIVRSFNNFPGLVQWFQSTWFQPQSIFRITNDMYQALMWTLLGDNSTLHHAMRWVLKAVIVWASFQVLRTLSPVKKPAIQITFWVFCVTYVFFPNFPEARLGTAEPLTVLFLALTFNELGRLFVLYRGDLAKLSVKRYLWLLFVFTGVLWSKEPNIVMGIITLAFLALLNLKKWQRLLPFAVIVLVTAARVWAKKEVAGYGVAPLTWELINTNFIWYTKSLFLCKTSFICSLLLAVPTFWGLIYLAAKTRKKWPKKQGPIKGMVLFLQDNPSLTFNWLVFLNLLAFYAIVLTSWMLVSRYYYPLVYLLTFWIALTLLHIADLPDRWRGSVTKLLIVASVFFIGVNYYNFVYQFACQYYTRIVEHHVIGDTDTLLRQGATVTLTQESEFEYNIKSYFNDFLPFYKKTDYRVTVGPPATEHPAGGCFYVTHHIQPDPAGLNWLHQYYFCHVSRILSLCDRISSWLQFGRPAYCDIDVGASDIGRHGEDISIWYMYNCHDIWGFA